MTLTLIEILGIILANMANNTNKQHVGKRFYVIDSTKNANRKTPVLLFSEVPEVIEYLEGMCLRKFGQTRKVHMQHCEDIGIGPDDRQGVTFLEQMAQYFNIGVIRKDSVPVRCNIFNADRFLKIKDTCGD